MCSENRAPSRPYYFDGVSTVAKQERKLIEGRGTVDGILVTGAAVGTTLTLRDGDRDGKPIFRYVAAAVANMDPAGGLSLGFDQGLYAEFTPAAVGASCTVTVAEPESGIEPFHGERPATVERPPLTIPAPLAAPPNPPLGVLG